MDGLLNGMLHGLLADCCGYAFLASVCEKVDAGRICVRMAQDTVDMCADLPKPKTNWVTPGRRLPPSRCAASHRAPSGPTVAVGGYRSTSSSRTQSQDPPKHTKDLLKMGGLPLSASPQTPLQFPPTAQDAK